MMEVEGGGDGGGNWGKFQGKTCENHVRHPSPHHKSPGLANGKAELAAASPQLGWE